jgi:hypothetical protein
VEVAASYQLQIQFTADMDPSSVDAVISKQLPDVKRSIRWEGERALQLTVEFAESDAGKNYLLSLSGSRTKQGMELKQNERMLLVPVQQVEVKAASMPDRQIAALYKGLNDFDTLSVSPNGLWYLKGEYVENQMSAELIYTLTDQQGRIIRAFDYMEVGYPGWLKDGHTLIYMKHTLKRQEVWLYNAATGEERLFWKVPDTAGDGDARQRVVAIAVDAVSGQIVIGAGAFNEEAEISVDVRWFETAEETEPSQTFSHLSSYTCYEGPCSAWIQFIGTGKLYFTTSNLQKPHAYPEAYILDMETGSKSRIDSTERSGCYSELRQVVQKGDSGVYLRVEQQENGNEAWKMYDVQSGESSEWETDLKLLSFAPFTGYHFGEDGSLLFLAKNKEWYAADPINLTVAPYVSEWLPKASDIVKLYGSDRNTLWYGDSLKTSCEKE